MCIPGLRAVNLLTVPFILIVAGTSFTLVMHIIFLIADIAVVTTNEVDFFSEEGQMIDRVKKPTANLRSLELDPVNKMLFLTDDTDNNYSIFTLSLEENQDLRPVIQSR
jgi:hypothetical protein